MEKQDLVKRLISEFGYQEAGAYLVAEKLMTLNPQLEESFESWLQTGELPAVSIESYTVDRLMREHKMNAIASILTLDYLIRKPEEAKMALARGYDHVKC